MKALLSLIISGALVISGYSQTRNVLVGTNNAVVQPTNFWSADASNARTGLGLGSAATNPASAFQPASSALTNLVSGNGGALTNLQATNLVGLIPTSNIPSIVLTSIGTITIQQGGTGATNAANARQNLGSTTVGDAVFIATNAAAARTAIGATTAGSSLFTLANPSAITFLRLNADNTVSTLSASDFRTALSLGTAATNPSSAFQPASTVLSNLASSNGVNLTNLQASSVTGEIAISNGGSGATTAGGARTNLGLGEANNVIFNSAKLSYIQWDTNDIFIFDEDPKKIYGNWEMTSGALSFLNSTNAATTRTNLGIGWPALTNTTASGFQTALFGTGTNPVLVNTNGEVVSPTNFWQVAPIATLLQNSTPVVNATNAATNARLLFLFSLAPSTVGVTNTITLPTNGGTFNGDVATITHSGPTNSVTAVRQLGASTNIITLNQVDESVRFLYRNNQWTLMDNISYIEPIYFSGTNAAANAAASRTNLGLGATNEVSFDDIQINESGEDPVFVKNESGAIQLAVGTNETSVLSISDTVALFNVHLDWANTTNAATTRTNLGLPLDALTNTSVTNFQKAIFYTNTAPSNIGGNLGTIAAWIEIVASDGVTYKIPAYTNVP